MPLMNGCCSLGAAVGEVDDDQHVAFGVHAAEAGAVAAAVAGLDDPVLEEPEAGRGVTGDAVAVEAKHADAVAIRCRVRSGEGVLDVVLVLHGRGRVLLPEPARAVVDVLRRAPGP